MSLTGSKRVGGWIESTRLEGDTVVYEHGPRTVRPVGPQGATTLALVTDLGLESEVMPIPRGHPATKNRMIYVDGKICPLPSSLMGLVKIMPPFKKPHLLAGARDLFAKPKYCQDDSTYNLVERRFGRDFADYFIDPMVRGICAGDSKEISADAFILKPVFRREQADGGLIKSLAKTFITKNSRYKPTKVRDNAAIFSLFYSHPITGFFKKHLIKIRVSLHSQKCEKSLPF